MCFKEKLRSLSTSPAPHLGIFENGKSEGGGGGTHYDMVYLTYDLKAVYKTT